MADQPFSGSLLICAYAIFLHILQNCFQNRPVLIYSKQAFRIGNNTVRAPCIEAGNRISLFIHANRVLRLVSISKRLLHSHNRLHNPVKLLRPESTDTKQIIPHLIVFKCKLLLIAHCLDLASSALPVKTAGRRYTKRRRCNHLL